MRDETDQRRRPKPARRKTKGERHQARTQLNRLRGMKVRDALDRPTKPILQSNQPKQATGEDIMTTFKVVPAPDDPGQFIVQSDPMDKAEADAEAKKINDMEEGEGEGNPEEAKNMPGFNAKPGGVPAFAKKPAAKPMMNMPGGGGSGAGMPPMGM